PAESPAKRIFENVFPPSVVLKSPRLVDALNGSPNTPMYATSVRDGWTRMVEMCSSRKPRNVQVFPPSLVLQSPSPPAVLPRMSVSPPPTQTTSAFTGSTATAPMVPPKYLSLMGSQVRPPS